MTCIGGRFEVQWLSPMGLAMSLPGAPRYFAAVSVGEAMAVTTLAARKAFWGLPSSYLKALAATLDLTLTGSLLDQVRQLILRILGSTLPEEELLELLAQRVFPPVVWDTEWTANESLLKELDSDLLDEIKVPTLGFD